MASEALRDLGNGLILRRAAPADAEALVAFNANWLREPEAPEPDARIGAWTRDLATRPHPTFEVGNFTVVEDTRSNAIVSTMCLIPQTWSYGGVEFGVGRPELVATHPDYRRRGLVRAQFEVVHDWSAERGHQLQAITGIPWFYRQFGYEMALDLWARRVGYKPDVPKLKEGQAEPYCCRPATEADLPFLVEVHDYGAKRSLVNCVRDEATWRLELAGRSTGSVHYRELRVLESAEGERVGYLAHERILYRRCESVLLAYELKPGVSWAAVTPSVIRYLQAIGLEYAARKQGAEWASYAFWLGVEHPSYQVAAHWLPRVAYPYAWYLRVPDLPRFVRTIAPVLERRLAESVLAGHTGELKISFYRDGLRLAFERGKLVAAERWVPPSLAEAGGAKFPGLTFLQLLFGYRAVEELEHAFADVGVHSEEARALLRVLFPKQPSQVWGLG
jgi:GNAT superfamily N-acetyltransferase